MKTMMIRIAFRAEGSFWNAYLAQEGTMENAKLIGSILIEPVMRNEETKRAFMATMKLVLADAVEAVTGDAPVRWDERQAPESERSGHS